QTRLNTLVVSLGTLNDRGACYCGKGEEAGSGFCMVWARIIREVWVMDFASYNNSCHEAVDFFSRVLGRPFPGCAAAARANPGRTAGDPVPRTARLHHLACGVTVPERTNRRFQRCHKPDRNLAPEPSGAGR